MDSRLQVELPKVLIIAAHALERTREDAGGCNEDRGDAHPEFQAIDFCAKASRCSNEYV